MTHRLLFLSLYFYCLHTFLPWTCCYSCVVSLFPVRIEQQIHQRGTRPLRATSVDDLQFCSKRNTRKCLYLMNNMHTFIYSLIKTCIYWENSEGYTKNPWDINLNLIKIPFDGYPVRPSDPESDPDRIRLLWFYNETNPFLIRDLLRERT